MGEDEGIKVEAMPTTVAAPHAEGDAARVGPLFISGRQHSGNTVTTHVFGMVPDCYAAHQEGWFFEHRGLVDKIKDPGKRARYIVDLLRLEDAALADRTRDWLARWHGEHPDAGSIEAYRQAMGFVTSNCGKRFWVRRATSYIFYAEDILRLMPEARLLYLLRNPYDVCASKKRRDPRRDRFVGWVVSWNRGLRLALKLQTAYPDRFLMVRYEDMATEPTETFRRIFAFAGVPFCEQYLDVPHVNRSEAAQTKTSATLGVNASRVYYYTGVLSSAEVIALDALVWKEKLADYYADLPHRSERRPLWARVKAVGILALSPLRCAVDHARSFFEHDPAWRLRRLLRRARVLAR